ncbi:MAG: hypothetical protein KIT31_36895 [Deltaproteobacteria bacterium]|nr:hypothetical protein [Deltaproteobacteria bacterium]
MLKHGLLVAGWFLAGACHASHSSNEARVPTIAKTPPPAPAKVAVEMTAATLGEDCGGTTPTAPPAKIFKAEKAEKADMADAPKAKGKSSSMRRCQQTSMQLAIVGQPGTPATAIKVKKVELYDDAKKLIGTLTASSPTVWSDDDGIYKPWNQAVASGAKLSVSYVLSQPDWSGVKDKASRAYVLKAVVTVGSADQTVEREAEVSAPTIMPPNVKT